MSNRFNDEEYNEKRYLNIEDLFLDSYNESFESDKNFTISELKKTLVLYRGVANINFNNEPSVNRNLSIKGLPLVTRDEISYYDELKQLDFFKAYENKETSLSFLARSQHYGYNSRLLDISYRKLTSVYFASSLYFNEDGKLYTYSHIDNKTAINTIQVKHFFLYSPTVDESRKNITRKLLLISNRSNNIINNPNYVDEVRVIENMKNVNSVMEHLSEPVIIIDRNEFYEHNASNDIRYESQKGLFIIYGNQHRRGVITDEIEYQSLNSNNVEYVNAEDKLVFLYVMAKKGVNFVTIYPDDDKSHKINRIIKMLIILNGGYSENLNDRLKDYSDAFDIGKLKILLQGLIKGNNQGLMQFLLSDFYEFAKKYKNNSSLYSNHISNFQTYNSVEYSAFMRVVK